MKKGPKIYNYKKYIKMLTSRDPSIHMLGIAYFYLIFKCLPLLSK